MKTSYECIPCFARQAAEAAALAIESPVDREQVLRRLMKEIATADWTGTPPAMGQRIHRIIREVTGNPDPYKRIKQDMNRMAESMIPMLRERLKRSEHPREDAVHLAIAGNLLDAGAKTQISAEELPDHLNTVFDFPLKGDLQAFFNAIDAASTILYLADNAGEIYFDRLFIETLPTEKVTVAVRGMPTINDATLVDAEAAGIPELIPVISNGSDAPATILEDTSPKFRQMFEEADLIISKGQGNYETLSDCDRNIFFLLTVKCPVIALDIGEPVGSMVVKSGKK